MAHIKHVVYPKVNRAFIQGENNLCTVTLMRQRVIDRALARARELGMDQVQFAKAIGESAQTITNWKRRDMPAHANRKVAKVLGWSVDQLLGLVTTAARAVILGDHDFPVIRRVQFKLSAGASGFAVEYLQDDEPPLAFRREWFESRGFDPSKLFAVRVVNHSMQPGLWEGDTVVVNTADTAPRDGEVFAVNYEGELVIKRLVRDAGQWWLVSDNPDQRRYPRKLCGESVLLIGRIVHKQSEHI